MKKKVLCWGETWEVSELGFIVSKEGSDLCRLTSEEEEEDPIFVPYIPQSYMGATEYDWGQFVKFAENQENEEAF